jgi:shikimate dehydrogenase
LISGKTRVLGVIGHPVEHTCSPAMHNAALAALELDWVYVAFHVLPEKLESAIAGMRGLGITGLNVTVPHKQAVMALLDEVSAPARAIGAVNTIICDKGRLTGHNTDAVGLLESLRHDAGMDRLPAVVALLGAGGAARAILYAVLQRPEVEQVLVLNRTVEKAESLAADLDHRGKAVVARLNREGCTLLREAGLVINSTSVGMHPRQNNSPLADPDCLHAGMWVMDIVYNPLRTRLMQQAEAAGAQTLNGLGMLVYQGVRAFELWTGKRPPVETMRAAALKQMSEKRLVD